MTLYFDTSAFSTLPLRDDGWPLVQRWLATVDDTPCLSDLTWGEYTSAVSMRARGGMEPSRAMALLAETAVWRADWRWVTIESADLALATDLVARFELGLRLPDAIRIAVARRISAILVTTDRRQAAAATTLGDQILNPLEGSG